MSAFFLIVNALFCHFLALKQAPLLAFVLCFMELPCVNEWCAVTNGFKYDDEDDVHGNCAAHDPKYKQQHIDLAAMKSLQLGMDAEDLSAKLMPDDVQIIQPFPQLFLGVSLMRLLVDLGPGVPPNLTNLIAGLESHSFTTTSAGRPSVDLAQGEPVGMPELVAIFYVRQFPFAALHIAKLNLAAITKYTELCLAAVGVNLDASDVKLIRNLTADCCELLVPLTTKEEALELVRNSEKRGVVDMLIGKYNTLGSDANAVSLWDKDKMSTFGVNGDHENLARWAWDVYGASTVGELHHAVSRAGGLVRAIHPRTPVLKLCANSRPTKRMQATAEATREAREAAAWKAIEYLEQYHSANGHCCVPQKYVTDDGYTLGGWVNRVRSGHTGLTDEQETYINDMGFVWNVYEANAWEAIEYLELYHSANGHCVVPRKYVTDDGFALGEWVSRVRSGHTGLTDEQEAYVNGMGFVWHVYEANAWEAIEYLELYHRANGHCRVPYRYVTSDNYKLGAWTQRVRVNRVKLTTEQREYINRMGSV